MTRTADMLLGAFAIGLSISLARHVWAQRIPATPNPCHVVVFKETQDSLYAELQAPRGTKRCVVEIK